MDNWTENSELPRERLTQSGSRSLSLAELLALILGSGTPRRSALSIARALVEEFGGTAGISRAGDRELLAISGLGPAKLAALRAALEIGERHATVPLLPGRKLGSPESVFAHFGPRLRHRRQESFYALLLDTRQRLIREIEVSRGSLNESLVHPREVFGPALREAAAALVVVHNHPSGDPQPSRQDVEVTRRLAEAGELLGIRLLDHVVIGASEFRSFARMGWLSAHGHRKDGR